MDPTSRKIAVIGLGYVGLPVAVAFGQKQHTIGFDKNPQRIESLSRHIDNTQEIAEDVLKKADIVFSDDAVCLQDADFYIVAVPTPISDSKQPDLTLLKKATETIAQVLKPGDIVVYESTVYPGTTEDECAPILENLSGLTCGKDFFVGYSPERINPGDKEHRLETIVKVVAGCDEPTTDIIEAVYGSIITAGIHRAPNIKTAEAAKVIENTQRDLNIALMNELSVIFNRMNIDTHDVLAAAETKWNFLPFKPGLVGGHCIGVDPYYLTYQAQRYGYHPQVILAGRRINDDTGKYVAQQTIKSMVHKGCKIKGARVAVLGLTFKENCPDMRNTRVIDIIRELESYHIEVVVHGAQACPNQAKQLYNIDMQPWDNIQNMDAIILAVPHDFYRTVSAEEYRSKFNGNQILVDVKAALDRNSLKAVGIDVWRM